MKRIILIIFATFSISVNALFDNDFSYVSDGTTFVCLNVKGTIANRSTDIKYSVLWGLNTVEKFIVHIKSPKVLISAYTPSAKNGGYRYPYGGNFDIINETNNVPYIEFGMRTSKDKSVNKTISIGRLNRFTGDMDLGGMYGPCKKTERLL